jgi:hypothetical protein
MLLPITSSPYRQGQDRFFVGGRGVMSERQIRPLLRLWSAGCLRASPDRRIRLDGSRGCAGSVWINCYQAMDPAVPFGGYKMSGYGRESGIQQMEEYLNVKAVWIKTA